MYDEYGNRIISNGYGGISFSRSEITQILISVTVLTACFTLVLLGVFDWTVALGIAAVVSVTGFLLHELAHKFVAQRYGAWAEFRMYPGGLLIALVFAFMGILFAAPGAVYIQGRINRRQNGMISLAGPLTNIVFGGIFVIMWLAIPGLDAALSDAIRYIGFLSLVLAGFNLIPFGPLDGKKILDWNPAAWAASMGVAAVLGLIAWGLIVI